MRNEYDFHTREYVDVEGSEHFREFDDVDEDTYFAQDLTAKDYKDKWKLTRWRPPGGYYQVQTNLALSEGQEQDKEQDQNI